ncbi:MAG: 16S rRNA (adenine(1518)-N(6)/adenine(1519)-N(6))-dimethyltransferase [Clostridiales bacterium]|nr:MAG: 16S rRNA (adenine(1518)-N(6)/adenine(1519)-N(6))-dimethyltransferase [Clostridiales bacterium]
MSQLTSIKYIKQIMEMHGVNFSKSLGQNFLTDDNIVTKIADGADIGPEDGVLEIGPGIGSLTEKLLNRAKKVVSVEIDKALWPILEEHFSTAPHFELVKEDVLKLDLNALIAEKFADCQRVKVVANLPYYITTPIIMNFLEAGVAVSDIVVMIQREVADRINAVPRTKAYGSLSVSAQFYAAPQILFIVPKGVFVPQPKVDSAVIKLTVLERPRIALESNAVFFKTVKAAFAQRRKTLLNTLSSPTNRAEQLNVEDFGRLADEIYRFQKTTE